MEPEGGSKRSADQLQSAALQDQAVRPVPAGSRLNGHEEVEAPGAHKIVIRFEDHAVRGYAVEAELGSIEQLLRSEPQSSLHSINLRMEDTGAIESITTTNAKAIFFVKTFNGDLRHRALHFHEHAPIVAGLWVRVSFHDSEVIEGIISNGRDFVLEHGFFMMPTDPNGNNRLIYVLKDRLKDFSVLGMRNMPKPAAGRA